MRKRDDHMCLPLEQYWPHEMSCKGKWNSLKKLGKKLKSIKKGMGSILCGLHINKMYTIVNVFFLNFLKLGQHDACNVKLFPSEVIGSSNCIEVALKAGLNSEINNSCILVCALSYCSNSA